MIYLLNKSCETLSFGAKTIEFCAVVLTVFFLFCFVLQLPGITINKIYNKKIPNPKIFSNAFNLPASRFSLSSLFLLLLLFLLETKLLLEILLLFMLMRAMMRMVVVVTMMMRQGR